MACARRNGAVCQHCQLLQEMRTIPAKFIPESIRTGLSRVLDPCCHLPDNDYRFFADRNGLTPDTVQWLDSQKTLFNTSSIKAVLDYLIQKHGNGFTVFNVYKTLCEMNSDGQRIIYEGMPEIRRLYRQNNQGTRLGQEHAEPLSANITVQPYPSNQRFNDSPPQPMVRVPSPPPPYNSATFPQSNHMDGGDDAFAMNNLNAGLSPRNGPDMHHFGGQNNRGCLPDKQARCGARMDSATSQQSQVQLSIRPVACEDSFHSNNTSQPNASHHCHVSFAPGEHLLHPGGYQGSFGPHDGREPAENSCFSGDVDTATLPSYLESQHQYSRAGHQRGMHSPSATQMQELKLPLEGPEVNPGSFSGQRAAQADSHMYGSRQGASPLASAPNRPASFPSSQPSSYKSRHGSARPISDSTFCSHSGACNCPTIQHTFIPPSVLGSNISDCLPSSVCGNHSHDCGHEMREAVSGVSAEGRPWDEGRHQTDLKQPLDGHHQTNSALQYHPTVVNGNANSSARCGQLSVPIRSPGQNALADRFVLVVAADIDETERLDQQVNVLCQHLQAQGIHYVLIKSTSTWPVLSLTPNLMGKLPPLGHDSRSLQDFVWGCFRRASKVLMVITPGYLRYADAYTGGAGRELTFQQKLMRKIQEKLKEEFFSQKRAFRIWPVILHELKANRNHLPSFLSSSVFYWFPYMQGMENVMEILRKDLSCPRNKVKRSI